MNIIEYFLAYEELLDEIINFQIYNNFGFQTGENLKSNGDILNTLFEERLNIKKEHAYIAPDNQYMKDLAEFKTRLADKMKKIGDKAMQQNFPYDIMYLHQLSELFTYWCPEVKKRVLQGVPTKKEIDFADVAMKFSKYISDADNETLKHIIQNGCLPPSAKTGKHTNAAKKPKWIGSYADAHRFKDLLGMTSAKWDRCFSLPNGEKLLNNRKSQPTKKEKEIQTLTKEYLPE